MSPETSRKSSCVYLYLKLVLVSILKKPIWINLTRSMACLPLYSKWNVIRSGCEWNKLTAEIIFVVGVAEYNFMNKQSGYNGNKWRKWVWRLTVGCINFHCKGHKNTNGYKNAYINSATTYPWLLATWPVSRVKMAVRI